MITALRDAVADALARLVLDPSGPWIFQVSDCDWWMARSPEEAKADYMKICGLEECDLGDEYPRRLSDAEMATLKYTTEDGHKVSFRAEFWRSLRRGDEVPGCFASTEY